MKNQLWVVLLLALGISSCSNKESQIEGLNNEWTLVGHSNIFGEINCEYEEGDVVWVFEDNKIKVDGRLVAPFGLQPCYDVDANYGQDFPLVIEEMDEGDIIYIEDWDFRAKLTIDEDLILEVVSSSTFQPSTEGVKVYFKKR